MKKEDSMQSLILEEYAKSHGYKAPSYEVFKEKCLQFFGIRLHPSAQVYSLDINEDIIDIFPKDCARLEQGIERMKKLKLSVLSSPNDEDYLKGMVDIYIALTDIENHFSNFRDAHIKISKKFRYISGEITLEEYLDDGVIELEDADDDEEEDL